MDVFPRFPLQVPQITIFMVKSMVNIEQVSKTYRHVQALNQINMQIEKGKIICLVGPNGSGKSSLIKIILGLSKATSGQVSFDQPNQTIGYLSELSALPNGYKGEEILHKLETLIGVKRSKNVDDLIKLFGMQDVITKKIKTYSKGMQKKIGLLLAFTGDPGLVILDEPFEGIDTIDRDKLSIFLKHYIETDKSVILSTHILHELDSFCSSAHFLHNGNLVISLDTQNEHSGFQRKFHFSHLLPELGTTYFGENPTISDIYRRIYQ